MLLSFLFYLTFLLASLLKGTCISYTGSTVTVQTFSQLQRAISDGVHNIIANRSINFDYTLGINGGRRSIVGESAFNKIITFTGPANSRLFNMSGANITLSNLAIIGSPLLDSTIIQSGGLMYVKDSTLNLINATVSQGVASCGGAIFANASDIHIIGTTFNNNSGLSSYHISESCGGAIGAYSGNIAISSSHFQFNYGYSGGAVSAAYMKSVQIMNSTFLKNAASDSGGSISIVSSTNVVISEMTCTTSSLSSSQTNLAYSSLSIDTTSCTSSGGGCLYTSGCKHISVALSTFQSCSSISNAAAINSLGDKHFVLMKSKFIGNSAQGEGGAFMCSAGSIISMQNNLWNKNLAGGLGGAISVTTNCSLTINNDQFIANTVSKNVPISTGGAIYCFNSHLSMNKSLITQSSASDSSLIHAYNCFISIRNSLFENSNSITNGIFAGYGSSLYVSNSTFYNLSATQSASTVTCQQSKSCYFKYCTFKRNHAFSRGNIVVNAASATMTNCMFLSNTATGDGAAVYAISYAKVSFTSCTFRNNSAGDTGGAIEASLYSSLAMSNCVLSKNTALSGGALSITHKSSVVAVNTTFNQNYGKSFGGSVFADDYSVFNGTYVMITNSISPDGGGVYCSYYSNVFLVFSVVTNNFAALTGGAIAAYNKATVRVASSTFSMNKAALGGAISGQYQVAFTAVACSFKSNIGSENGGVGYFLVGSILQVLNCVIQYNRGGVNGGAFQIDASSVSIISSKCLENDAGSNGGFMIAINSTVNFIHSQFQSNGRNVMNGGVISISVSTTINSINNSYIDSQAEYGGVISMEVGTLNSNSDLYLGCSAVQGGCIYSFQGGILRISDSVFKNVTVNTTYGQGGIIFAQSGGRFLLQSSLVAYNHAQNGLIVINSANAKFINVTFLGNQDVSNAPPGSIIYLSQASKFSTATLTSYTATITSCNFTSNTFKRGNGGAISADNFPGVIFIQGSYFKGNSAYNGGAIGSTSSIVKISSSTFIRNSAKLGGGAIYWIYNTMYATTVGSSCTSIANSASYGNFIATDLVGLNATVLNSNVSQVSGQVLKSPIVVSLLDYYDQVVTGDTVTVLATVYNSTTSTLKGSTIVRPIEGVATFSNVVVTGLPGEPTSLMFSVSLSRITSVVYTLYFRECISGEITEYSDGQLKSAACYKCGIGTYSYFPTDSACSICPINAQCPGGNVVNMNSNYWRSYQESSILLQCPVYGVCLGGSNVTTQCVTGATGAYCSVCLKGYVSDQSGVCYDCNSGSTLATKLSVLIAFMVALIFSVMAYRFRNVVMSCYERFLSKQVIALLTSPKYKYMRVKVKILVAFFQIMSSVGPALNIVFPPNFVTYTNYYSIFDLNILSIPGVNCLFSTNYYSSLVITTILPFIVFFLIAVSLRIVVMRAKRLNSRRPYYTLRLSIHHTIMVAFILSYFVLVDVSVKIFQVFQCKRFDNGDFLLVADYSIRCDGSDRKTYLTYGIIMMFIYPIGIPLTYAAILIYNRKKINPSWRLVIENNEKKVVNEAIIQAEKIKVRNTHKSIDKFRNLFDAFTPKRWYFEIFDCIRRLLLGAIPVLIARGTFLQIVFVLVVSLGSVAMFMQLKPYIYESDNQVAVIAQWSITCVLIAAMILKVESSYQSGGNSTMLGALLIILNLAVIVLAIGATIVASNSAEEKAQMLSNEQEDGDKDEEYDDDDDDESAGHRSEGKDTDNVVILGIKADHRTAASPAANSYSDSYKLRSSEGIELNPIHKTVITAPAVVINSAVAAAPTRGKSSRPTKDVDSDDEF